MTTSVPKVGAIPTTYAGVEFRSRLEARWAVFFDLLGLQWDPEPETYSDGQTMYVPDFWLPDLEMFWEVKPTQEGANRGLRKAQMLAMLTGKEVFVSVGTPWSMIEPWKGEGFHVLVERSSPRNPPWNGCVIPVWLEMNSDGSPLAVFYDELPKDFCSRYENKLALKTGRESMVMPALGMSCSLLSSWREDIAKAAEIASGVRFHHQQTGNLKRLAPLLDRPRSKHDKSRDCGFHEDMAVNWLEALSPAQRRQVRSAYNHKGSMNADLWSGDDWQAYDHFWYFRPPFQADNDEEAFWRASEWFLQDLKDRGFSVWMEDDELRIEPSSVLGPDDLALIKEHRVAIVGYLTDGIPGYHYNAEYDNEDWQQAS